MELEIKNNEIVLNNKKINNLDKFVLSIKRILEKNNLNYVIVSGYLSIFFGRARATEDIDILIEKNNVEHFISDIFKQGYWIINADNLNEALLLLNKGNAIRVSKKNRLIPNAEIKFAKNEIEYLAIKEKIKVCFDKNFLYFSPIELQIAYKLFLGSDKDIEDARHLFNIFQQKINFRKLKTLAKILRVEKKLSILG